MTAVAPRPDVVTDPPEREPRGDRFVGVGLLLMVGLFVTVQLLAREVIPPLAGAVVVYLALAGAVLRWQSRGLLVGVIALLVVHLGTSLPFFTAALAHPESPGTFLPDTAIGLVALATIAGAVAGLRGAASRRPIIAVAGVLAAVGFVVSLVAAAGVESDLSQPDDIPVEVARSTYPDLEVPAGGAVLWVDNQDPFRHTLVIEGADVHIELPGATAVRVEADLAPGTYRYYCDVFGHERMEGELVAR